MNDKAKSDIDALFAEVVKTLASVIEEKDAFLRGHGERVAGRGVAFARHLQLPAAEMKQLYLAGLLHDLGMVCLPDTLLGKADDLTEDERLAVEQHPIIAERILAPLSLLRDTLPAIRHHHEAFDGSGYPDGLDGEEIPVSARMLAIVDGYDAMTSPRSHRPAMPPAQALGQILVAGGKRYDPAMAKAFIDFMADSEKIFPAAAPPAPATGAPEPPDPGTEPMGESRLNGRDLVLEIVQRLKDGVPELPVLPAVAKAVLREFRSPTTSTDRLVQIVEMDAVLTLGVITAANSVWHGGIDKITSIRKAIPRLGFEETRKAVDSTAKLHIFESPNTRFTELMQRLWLHDLACAYASRAISHLTKIGDPDDIFLMGLLHDVGKLPLLRILCRIDDKKGNTLEIDEILKSLQDVHGSFGAAILKRWGFAREFQRVAALHDKQQFTAMTDKPVLIVHLANRMARQIGFGLSPEEAPVLEQNDAAATIGVGDEAAERIRHATVKMMKLAGGIF